MNTIRSEKRKAKKNHMCDLCFYTIEPGETYDYQFNVDGGDSWSFKAHLECISVCDKLNLWEEDPLDGDTFHEIIEDRYYVLTKNTEKMNFIDKLDYIKDYYETKRI